MKTTTHTPEPWALLDPDQVRGPEGEFIADCSCHQTRALRDHDNAARIVACVNACAGMADPAAEIAALRATLDNSQAQVGELMRRRDALREALQMFVAQYEGGKDREHRPEMKAARAALNG